MRLSLRSELPQWIIIAAMFVAAALVAVWWITVAATNSFIFPTPRAVVEGTLELAKDGSLWEHIGSSLMRLLRISRASPAGTSAGVRLAVSACQRPFW